METKKSKSKKESHESHESHELKDREKAEILRGIDQGQAGQAAGATESKKLSQQDVQKIEKRIALVIGVVILIIALVFIVGAVKRTFFSPTFEYKGLQVTKTRLEGINVDFYVLEAPVRFPNEVKFFQIFLRNDPRTLSDIVIEDDVQDKVIEPRPDQVFLTFDPDSRGLGYISLSLNQIARILGTSEAGIFEIPTTGAVIKPIEGFEDSIDCNDSGNSKVVIFAKIGDETSVRTDDAARRCIIVQGTSEQELLRATDAFVLKMLGL